MLPEDHPNLSMELQRRLERQQAGTSVGGGGDKWKEQHANAAESLGIQWPLTPSESLATSEWYATLPEREQQAGAAVLMPA